MNKLISIIIPCYNVEKYIDRCIRSLVRQSIGIERLTLILVNDASTDGTWERMKVWEKRFPDSICLISLPENLRQGGARNKGLEYADTPFIGFVDSDDWVEETMYEKLYQKMEEYQPDLVCCLSRRDWGDGWKPENLGKEDIYKVICNIEDRKKMFLEGLPGGVYCKLYRRDMILNSNIRFPEHLVYEDNYWGALIVLSVNNYYVLQEELYHYFVNTESTVLKTNSLHHLDRMKIELMKLDAYKERGVLEIYKQEIEFGFLRLYYLNTMNLLLLRFDEFPQGVFKELRETVHRLFPDYLSNPYLDRFHEMERIVLATLDEEFKEEALEGFARRYKEIYKVK